VSYVPFVWHPLMRVAEPGGVSYFKEGKVKIEIGLCRGKHLYDKRDTIKKREADREMERAMKRVK